MSMIKLCIFDLDGLLIDSEIIFINTAKLVSDLYAYNIPEDLLYSVMGKTEEAIKQMYLDRMGNDFDFETYQERRVALRYEYIKDHPVERKKGVDELFAYLDANNIKKALATSSAQDRADFYLKQVNLLNVFDHIVYGNQISHSKPHPEVYIKAKEAFNFQKEEIFAFEDSNNGILSAYNADLNVIHIPDLAFVEENTKKKAYLILNNLSETIEIIDKINSK